MTDTNNTPTSPGWHYRRAALYVHRLAYVFERFGGLFYYLPGDDRPHPVKDDGRWRGEVPMEGEWVSREEYDELMQGREHHPMP